VCVCVCAIAGHLHPVLPVYVVVVAHLVVATAPAAVLRGC
jgi:hypothetical protein